MNPLLDIIISKGLLIDSIGMIGLGILALAAIRLSKKEKSWGGSMMAYGAFALLVARIYVTLAPHILTNDHLLAMGPAGISLTYALPPILLTFGLAGVVWGLWGHEKWLKES